MGKQAITMVIDPEDPPVEDPLVEQIEDPPVEPIEDPPVEPIEDPPVEPIEDPPPADPEEPPEVLGVEEDDEWRSQTTARLDQIEKNQIGTTQVVSRLEKKEKSREKPQRKGRRRLLKL